MNNPYMNQQQQQHNYNMPPPTYQQQPYGQVPPQGYPMGQPGVGYAQPQGYMPPPQPTMYNTQPLGYNTGVAPAGTTKITYVTEAHHRRRSSDSSHHHHHSHNRDRNNSRFRHASTVDMRALPVLNLSMGHV
eukprot:403334297